MMMMMMIESPKQYLSSLHPTHPLYFYANLDEVQDPNFQKWDVCTPRLPHGSASGCAFDSVFYWIFPTCVSVSHYSASA